MADEDQAARPAPQAVPGYFEAPICRNCGAERKTAYCSQCGQKRLERLGLPDLGAEIWKKLRVFELDMLRAGLTVLFRPGIMARHYVLGRRKTYLHPLTLLFATVVALLVLLEATGYFAVADETLSKALALVIAYSNWSFSLGLFAIFVATLTLFGFGFNLIELLVLAAYTQSCVLLFNMIGLLPLAVWRGAEALALHKAVAGPVLDTIECSIVALAMAQFFALDWSRHWPRLLIATGAFFVAKKLLIHLYAMAVIRLVVSQLS